MTGVATLATNTAATDPHHDSRLTTPGRKKEPLIDWFFTHNLLFAAINAAEGHV